MRISILFLFLLLISLSNTDILAQGWQWGRICTQTGVTEAWAVATDHYGNVFVCGNASSLTGLPALFDSVSLPFPPSPVNFATQLAIAKYDPSGKVLWAKNIWPYATSGLGVINITTDSKGNLLVLGSMHMQGLRIGSFTLSNTIYPETQYFLAKLDPLGNLLWAKSGVNMQNIYFASLGLFNWSPELCGPGAIATDTSDNVYVTVNFHLANITLGPYSYTNANPSGFSDDIFLAKYDPSGNVVWTQKSGGTANDDVYSLTVTPAGDVYIAGIFTSPSVVFGPSVISHNPVISSNPSVFIARYDNNGNPLWAYATGNEGGEFFLGLSSDANNNVYLSGCLSDTGVDINGTPMIKPYQGLAQYTKVSAAFLAKIDPANHLDWYKTIGVPTGGHAYGMANAVSPCDGSIWMVGGWYLADSSINIEGHIVNTPPKSEAPTFIVGYTPNGTLIDYTTLNQGSDDQIGIACDPNNNIYIASDYDTRNTYQLIIGPDTFPSVPPTNNPVEWLFVAKYSPPNVWEPDTVFNSMDTLLCPNTTIVLHAIPGYNNYLWSNDSAGLSNTITDTGTYWLISSSACKTTHIDTFSITTINNSLSFSLGNDTTACATSILLKVSIQGVSYLWQDGSIQNTYRATHSGSYYVTISEKGCSSSDTINVTLDSSVFSQYLHDTLLCKEDNIQLQLKANAPAGTKILWSTAATDPIITATDTGKYWVTVTDNICSYTDTMTLKSEFCDCKVFIPNAFTPNADEKNDLFRPLIQQDCMINNYHFTVYNRWGERVFSSSIPGQGWNGVYQNALCEIGTYEYVLTFNGGSANKQHFMKGDLTLIR